MLGAVFRGQFHVVSGGCHSDTGRGGDFRESAATVRLDGRTQKVVARPFADDTFYFLFLLQYIQNMPAYVLIYQYSNERVGVHFFFPCTTVGEWSV